MALKAKIKNLEEVEEQFRGLYTQVKDGYELAVDGAESHSAYGSISGQLETLKNKFKDVDPAKYAELVAAETEFKQLQAKIDEATGSIKTQLTEQFNAEKTKLTQRQEVLTKALHEALVVSAATQALSQVAPENVKLLLPHVISNMKVIEKDGKFEAKIVDDKGQPRVITGKDGVVKDLPLWDTSEEAGPSLLGEMRENKEFMGGFPAVNKGGGGADPNTGASGGAGGGGAAGKFIQVKRDAPFEDYRSARERATKEGAQVQLVD